MSDVRKNLLTQWATSIAQAAQSGALDGGKPITIHSIETVCGPRAGALEIHSGFDTGRLQRVLSAGDCALHRQFVPWRFEGEPSVYLVSRYVRLEAAWPTEMAESNIQLASLGLHPKDGGRWIAGKNETGATVTLSVSDRVPHYLFGGWTGSGKTWALRSALLQLSGDPDNQLVLIDGKFGDGLGCLGHIPGLVGPVAVDVESSRAALAWAVREMRERYGRPDRQGRIIVCIDEIQEFTGKSGDALITEFIRKLASQGRGAGVHLFIGTQHPVSEVFTDGTIRRNLPGRVALRTEDAKASQVVIGASMPRADRLLGAGDCYCVTPSACHRAQLAYVPAAELEKMSARDPVLSAWPEADAEAGGTLPDTDAPRWEYGGDELAIALVAVSESAKAGRGALRDRLEGEGLGRPGSDRADRLLALARDMRSWLVVNDYCLPARQGNTHAAGYKVSGNGKVVSVPGNQAGRQEVGDAVTA